MATSTPDSPEPLKTLSDSERKALLDDAIARALRQKNRRLESCTDFQVIIVRGKPVNHLLHLLLTLCTVGLWGLVWLTMLGGGEDRAAMHIDPYGQITTTQR